MPLLIFRGIQPLQYADRQKMYFSQSPLAGKISSRENFFPIEASGVICKKLLSTIVSIDIINKLGLIPTLKKYIKIIDGSIEQDFFDLQLKSKKIKAVLKVIPAIIPSPDIHFILGQDYLRLVNEQPVIKHFLNGRLMDQPSPF